MKPMSDLKRRLLHNLTWQSTSQAVGLLLGTATVFVLTRRLGPAGWGKFSFLFAFIYFFQALSDLGVNTILLRDIANTPSNASELVRHTLGLKVALATVSMAVAWAIVAVSGYDAEQRWSIYVFALILPIQAMTTPIVTLQARLLLGRAAMVDVINRVTGFALMMTAVHFHAGLIGVTAGLVAGEMAGLIAVVALTHRFALPIPTFDSAVWRRVLTASLPLGAVGLLVALVNRVDFIMLKWMLPPDIVDAQIGFYGAAYKVTGLLERVPLLIMTTLFPIMAQLATSDPERLRRLYSRSLLHFAAIAVPMVIVVTAFAPLIVRILCGVNFGPTVPMLRALIWSTACVLCGGGRRQRADRHRASRREPSRVGIRGAAEYRVEFLADPALSRVRGCRVDVHRVSRCARRRHHPDAPLSQSNDRPARRHAGLVAGRAVSRALMCACCRCHRHILMPRRSWAGRSGTPGNCLARLRRSRTRRF